MIVYSYHPTKIYFIKWDLTISYEPFDENRRYKVYNYKRLAKLHDIPVEQQENIRCLSRCNSFITKEVEFINNDTFRFGKYAGKKINEVKNYPYIKWYYSAIENDEHKQFVHDFLYDNWYEFRTNEYGEEYVVSPKTIKFEKERAEKINNFIKKLNPHKKYYLFPEHNPNSEGKIKIDDITYIFPKVKKYYYRDIYYYLPVCNGKSKRIKNKKLECYFTVIDNEIFISNFKIVK